MKILWLLASLLPQVARLTGEPEQPFGGWLVATLDQLLKNEENEVFVCYRSGGAPKAGASGRLSYRSFEQDTLSYSSENEALFTALLYAERPDVVHIWGTEYPSALAMLNALERLNWLNRAVVSIQGLTSVYARHYEAGLPARVVRGATLRDFLRRDNIAAQKQKFEQRGLFEIEALKKARHVIGRTRWDRDCSLAINPRLTYHHCDETLRDVFYEGGWTLNDCARETIFVSQGDYPIKGFHQALEALALILRAYPNAALITTGADPRKGGVRALLRRSGYARYLARRMRALKLGGHVLYLGQLSAEGMKRQYLSAHLALNPSSIENSSNAIGEAMLLGTPVVASRVGGTPDMLGDGESGILYPFGEPEALAAAVCRIFGSDALAADYSARGRKAALQRHDREKNVRDLVAVYQLLVAAAPEKL